MLGALIIVFREVIEAGLIIGIVLAATRRMPGSRTWIFGGVAAGVLGSCLVAASTNVIAQAFDGFGQELFNAAILATAVIMLIWHNVWMARHGRSLAVELRNAGRDVEEGKRPLIALSVVVGAAVLREGAEVVLFLYGISISQTSSASGLLTGGLLGLGLGGLVSAVTYLGLVQISSRYIFAVTSWLIALLAAGLAAQTALLLQQAGVVTVLTNIFWDASSWMSEKSILGMILHAMVGYSEQPTVLQVIAYCATLLVIFVLTRLVRKPLSSAPLTP